MRRCVCRSISQKRFIKLAADSSIIRRTSETTTICSSDVVALCITSLIEGFCIKEEWVLNTAVVVLVFNWKQFPICTDTITKRTKHMLDMLQRAVTKLICTCGQSDCLQFSINCKHLRADHQSLLRKYFSQASSPVVIDSGADD